MAQRIIKKASPIAQSSPTAHFEPCCRMLQPPPPQLGLTGETCSGRSQKHQPESDGNRPSHPYVSPDPTAQANRMAGTTKLPFQWAVSTSRHSTGRTHGRCTAKDSTTEKRHDKLNNCRSRQHQWHTRQLHSQRMLLETGMSTQTLACCHMQ